MKLKVQKSQIIDGLLKAAAVLPSKAGAAYLRSLWLRAKDGSLAIMATDANIEFVGSYPADIEKEGLVGIPGLSFVDLVRKLPDGQIELSADDGASSILVKEGRKSYKLPVNGPEWFQEFSAFPEDSPVIWTGEVFMDILSRVPFCIDDDDAREATSCICFKPRGGDRLDICGLNGHQFALVSYIQPDLCAKLGDSDLLIQKKYLPDIRKWLDPNEIEINLSDKRLYLKGKNGAESLSVPRAHFSYPDYNLFMSKLDEPGISELNLSRKEAIDSLGRISIFNTDTDRCVFMDLGAPELKLSAEGADIGSAMEELEVDYAGSLKKIAFPTKSLMEIFGHFNSDRMNMLFTGAEGPCGVKGSDPEDRDYIVIIMPMKVSDKTYYSEEDD
ncbi:MAG: DNA polymerase III subunit beta [Desulfovibrio sp.]|nr:DNA polymerase III subunit beta [Desulfovibrio sp.]